MDGFAFSELTQRQESVTAQREELEKQKKLLNKRKPLTSSSSQSQATGKSASSGTFIRPPTPRYNLRDMDISEMLLLCLVCSSVLVRRNTWRKTKCSN